MGRGWKRTGYPRTAPVPYPTRLASGAEVRLRSRADRPRNGRAHAKGHRDQPGHCVADHADDSAGSADSRACSRCSVLRPRNPCSRRLLKKKGLKPPSTLGEAVRLVARMGGYLGRANDPPPGHQLMWQGYSQLQLMCEGFTLRDSETATSGTSPG